ncbi:MAG: hypothetical protein HOO91_18150 [Bacteroidales bacterium]|nr:hypothetical protein [Bacteroidales bacterium]
MTTNNKLDKSFGPIGMVAGITIFVTGIILVFFSLSGLFLIILGAFVGFSSTSTLIDFDKKRIKFSNNLFGIISVGKWLEISTDMKIGIKKSNKTWRTYSQGSRSLDISNQDFRIILYDSANKQIMPVKKSETLDSAKIEIEKLSKQLGLGIIEHP